MRFALDVAANGERLADRVLPRIAAVLLGGIGGVIVYGIGQALAFESGVLTDATLVLVALWAIWDRSGFHVRQRWNRALDVRANAALYRHLGKLEKRQDIADDWLWALAEKAGYRMDGGDPATEPIEVQRPTPHPRSPATVPMARAWDVSGAELDTRIGDVEMAHTLGLMWDRMHDWKRNRERAA